MVQLTNVTKRYGRRQVLGPISLEIDRGDTVGVLGLNGVGKTTLLKILACGLRPSSGSVVIDGYDVLENPHDVRKRVGYLPESPPVYGDMTVGDYLSFAGRIRGMAPDRVAARIPAVQERTHIRDMHDVPTRHLSQGYRQRVGVAQAIIHDPDLLILDEPTHDLDPVQIMEMRSMIQGLKESHTILISSHILPEISQTCDRLLILNDGRIVASGTEAELGGTLLQSRSMSVSVRLPWESEAAPGALEVIQGVDGVAHVQESPPSSQETASENVQSFQVEGQRDLRADVCRALVENGHDVVALSRADRALERLFVELVGADPK